MNLFSSLIKGATRPLLIVVKRKTFWAGRLVFIVFFLLVFLLVIFVVVHLLLL